MKTTICEMKVIHSRRLKAKWTLQKKKIKFKNASIGNQLIHKYQKDIKYIMSRMSIIDKSISIHLTFMQLGSQVERREIMRQRKIYK